MDITGKFFAIVLLFAIVLIIIGAIVYSLNSEYLSLFITGVSMVLYISVTLIIIFAGLKYLSS